MKMFRIHHFTLIMMMVVLVYAASTKKDCKKILLKDIRIEAKNLSTQELGHIMVTKVYSDKQTCVPGFFCLAEQALKNATHVYPNMNNLTRLTRYLHSYNKQTGENSCHLNMTHRSTYNIKRFLKDVEKCVDYSLNKTTT